MSNLRDLYDIQDYVNLRVASTSRLSANPEDDEAVRYLALSHFLSGDKQSSIKILDNFLTANSQSAATLELISEIILGSGKLYAEIKLLKDIFDRCPLIAGSSNRIKYYYAETCFHYDQFNEARNLFRSLPSEMYNDYYRSKLEIEPDNRNEVDKILDKVLNFDFDCLAKNYSYLITNISPGSISELKLRSVMGRFESLPFIRARTDRYISCRVSGERNNFINSKVIETFLYGGETDMLLLHMMVMRAHVDHFVIIQSDMTFTGSEKPIHDIRNDPRFLNYREKITEVSLGFHDKNCELFKYPWFVEALHRNAAQRFLPLSDEGAIFIISDVDEILREETVAFFLQSDALVSSCRLREHKFFLNLSQRVSITDDSLRMPELTTICRYKLHLNLDAFTIRGIHSRHPYFARHTLNDAGWHFSSVGSPEQIKRKYMNYSHTENNISKLGSDFYADLVSGLSGDRNALSRIVSVAPELSIETFRPMEIKTPDYPAILSDKNMFSHLKLEYLC